MQNKILVVTIMFSMRLAFAASPSTDLTGDRSVNFSDFAVMAAYWPATDFSDLTAMANEWLTCETEEMVLIPEGTFEMGDRFGDYTGSYNHEQPVHWVFIDAFMIARHEVTNRQYVEFLNNVFSDDAIEVRAGIVYKKGTTCAYCDTYDSTHASRIGFTGSRFMLVPSDRANHPVTNVSWYGAAAYCNWRSEQLGKELCYNTTDFTPDLSRHGCRLPTEAEWEAAARGGLTGKRFPWGDTISHSQANYSSSLSYAYDVSPTRSYHPTYWVGSSPYTAPVGSFSANGYGLFDTSGNVWEWCNDWYSSSYYSSSAYYNPSCSIGGPYRVIRGGSWSGGANFSRVASRHDNYPTDRYTSIGFRIALDLE